ncbi:adenosylcobinamide-phosphate synthase CbiB [Gammaproteobacteria bacterium AS21]
MFFSFLVVLLALLLDYKFAELSKHHPLVYYGNFVSFLEKRFNHPGTSADNIASPKAINKMILLKGIIAWLLAVLPLVYLSYLVDTYLQQTALLAGIGHYLFASVVLYIAIGWRSLNAHAMAIVLPLKKASLKQGDIKQARIALSYIVSRDTKQLNETQISNAATESVLENGSDAIFAAIFWFLILGVPGVVLYRCANTLDAMWGYKNPRYLSFGWMAARSDDVLNYLPARLTAYSYALLGCTVSALECAKAQGVNWKSPNAGPVMAAGAGAIRVRLGGGSFYHGQWQDRPVLGKLDDKLATCFSIQAACLLVDRVVMLWLLAILVLAVLI